MSENLSCLNFLELSAVFFALRHFCSFIQGHHVLVRTDNTTMVAYITRQGEVCSRQLHSLVRRLILWSRDHFLSLGVTHVLGALNAGADMLSSTPMYREWTLHAGVVERIWVRFSLVSVDLFASRKNVESTLFFSLHSVHGNRRMLLYVIAPPPSSDSSHSGQSERVCPR